MADCDETPHALDLGSHRIRALTQDEAISAMEEWILRQIEKEMAAKGIKCDGDCHGGAKCGMIILDDVDKLIGSPKLGRDQAGHKCYVSSIAAHQFTFKCACANDDSE